MTHRPSFPLTGGCQCGAVRYEITGAPMTLYACHCTDCQTQSASAFGMSMPVLREHLHCDLLILGTWKRTAESGRTVNARFCTICGTRLFHEPSRNPAIVNVKPGTLDDTSWLKPVGHLWLSSKQPWFSPPEETLHYSGQPGHFDELFSAFAEEFSRHEKG